MYAGRHDPRLPVSPVRGLSGTLSAFVRGFRHSALHAHGHMVWVLVRESAEDLFPADPVLGEVDHRRPGVSLSRAG